MENTQSANIRRGVYCFVRISPHPAETYDKKSLPILVASLIYSFQEWLRFECENKGTFRRRIDCVEEPLDISALREKKLHFLSNFSHLRGDTFLRTFSCNKYR
ncbi:hypothetical protein RB195_017775 [Necator americanus]|uniref:Uncharacterized protein n=1 Tax=Necator americanus TaxID=51031 RepID=A0ABR1C6R7_NECAM